MKPYQEQYIKNAREISVLCDISHIKAEGFGNWYKAQMEVEERIHALRQENMDLLEANLFPLLDELHSAKPEDIAELEEFSDKLMDWVNNLDAGIYVVIHGALLRLYRVRKDRGAIIKELYKLGMGLYYRNRVLDGIDRDRVLTYLNQNEMVFTEAGSYLKYFSDIPDEETKGYIIRALANVAICTADRRRSIAVTARILRIIKDDYYRQLAPGLPWETFLRRTNQQMSSNRTILSRGNLSTEELASVMESCYEVFTPEVNNSDPNIRWLWPYYEMEYSCGFVDLNTTLQRLQSLITRPVADRYDESGLYQTVQLPVYYGKLMAQKEALQSDPKHVRFLAEAYEGMMQTLMSVPVEAFSNNLFYDVRLVLSEYLEIPGLPSYREISEKLMQRFSGQLYIRSRRIGDMIAAICSYIFSQKPDFFDDIPFIGSCTDPDKKLSLIIDHAEGCGLYHDFGRIKMNMDRTMQTRELFDDEFQIFTLHAIAGHDDLAERSSTEAFADAALGHHSWYNGSDGYPDSYVRNDSPYRQMTDVTAAAVYLADNYAAEPEGIFDRMQSLAPRQFSPMVAAYLSDKGLQKKLRELLEDSGEAYYREVWHQLTENK